MKAVKKKTVGRPNSPHTTVVKSASLQPATWEEMEKAAEFMGIKTRSGFIKFLWNFWKGRASK